MNVDSGLGTETLSEAVIVSQMEASGLTGSNAAHHDACANCGTALAGAYCHQCGQSAHIHRSLLHLAEEFLHGLLHFDTKSWRTIPALIVHPGKLTYNYIHGQRTRYVSPLALFLFLIFLMFFVFSLTTSSQEDKASQINLNIDSNAQQQAGAELDKQIGAARQKLNELESQSRSASQTADTADKLKDELADVKMELATLEKIRSIQTAAQAKTDKHSEKTKGLGEVLNEIDLETSDSSAQGGWLNQRLKHAAANPDLVLYKMKSAASKFAFLLMPISLPFLWLLFAFRRQFKMFDHAVFSLYSLSFMSLLMMLIAVVNRAGFSGLSALLFVVVPPAHMFVQLRGAYGLTNGESLWRTCALLVVAFCSLLVYVLLIAGISM